MGSRWHDHKAGQDSAAAQKQLLLWGLLAMRARNQGRRNLVFSLDLSALPTSSFPLQPQLQLSSLLPPGPGEAMA